MTAKKCIQKLIDQGCFDEGTDKLVVRPDWFTYTMECLAVDAGLLRKELYQLGVTNIYLVK